MVRYKAYKFRIYSNELQRILIEKTFGCTRFVFNIFLVERKQKYEENKTRVCVYEQIRELTELKQEKLWLKEVDSCTLQACVYNLDNAFQNFFHGKGCLKFRVKGVHESYRTNNTFSEYKGVKYESIKIDFKNHLITLPKLKKVKFRGYINISEIPGKISSATISKDANKYFVSVLDHVPFINLNKAPASVVGLDLGIKDFVVTSNGEKLKMR